MAYDYTVLKNRILWADGTSTYPSADIEDLIETQSVSYVDELNDYIRDYNALVAKDKQITVKMQSDSIKSTWTIPVEYTDMDIFDELASRIVVDDDVEQRVTRFMHEYALYEKLGLIDVLRSMIYVVNILTDDGVVWGVGRGSCVSSYILYLIGVHDIDSFAYDLDIDDFLQQG